MKKVSLLMTMLCFIGLMLSMPLGAQNNTKEEAKPLFTITASTTNEELDGLKSKIKEVYNTDLKYSLQRNTKNQITSLLLKLKGTDTNNNLSLSGDQPIKAIYIIKKPNGKLGIRSKRSERNMRLGTQRLQQQDSLHGGNRAITMQRLQSKIRKSLENTNKTMKASMEEKKGRQSHISLSSRPDTDPLFVINGVPQNKYALELLDKDYIKHINVLKGEKALEKYGEDGNNGVIEVVMKDYKDVAKPSFTQTIEINASTTDVEIASIIKKLAQDGATLSIKKLKRNTQGKITGYALKFNDGYGSKINTSKQGKTQEITPLIIRYDQDGKISIKQ